MSNQSDKTYYEILEIGRNASEIEIKKAYRRLALKYHPDRNVGVTTTERFQEIGQAYECLSNSTKKQDYDDYLTYGRRGSGSGGGRSSNTDFEQHQHYQQHQAPSQGRFGHHSYHRQHDAFAQFDHLFRTDPFFQQGFQDLDDEFARRFQQKHQQSQYQQRSSTSPRGGGGGDRTSDNPSSTNNEGWIPWLLRQCGIQLQVTSYRTDGRGNVQASHYTSTNQTSKSSQTYIDPHTGQQITTQTMQRGPNKIQDKYRNGQLIERRVNGQIVDLSSTRIENS